MEILTMIWKGYGSLPKPKQVAMAIPLSLFTLCILGSGAWLLYAFFDIWAKMQDSK